MAVTAYTLDRAEFTPVYATDGAHLRPLPWFWWRVGGPGEERRYIVPFSGLVGGGALGPIDRLILTDPEYQADRPFPLESHRAARGNSGEDRDIPGPIAIHYFGRV